MERSAEEARISRASVFPQSVGEYQSMDVPAAQLRVARYLMADDSRKELMRTESSWALQQTKPLDDLYQANVSVKGLFYSLYKRSALIYHASCKFR